MSDKRTNLEVIAPTVEEAIAKGLAELGVSVDQVEIAILDEGNRGLFGLGSRQVRIRLTLNLPVPAPSAGQPNGTLPTRIPQPAVPAAKHEATRSRNAVQPAAATRLEGDQVLDMIEATVLELLEKMGVNAQVTTQYDNSATERERQSIKVDITGRNLSVLIGHQAEILNALQFIANLIVSKELGQSVNLLLDVEGYRARREQQIRQLARRMADQAIKTGRRQALEPMPASERRLVHLELRGDEDVTTESIGEEPHRKVTIVPNVSTRDPRSG